DIGRRTRAGDQVNGIFFCAIFNGDSRLAAKSISRSIHYRMAIILHRSCGISFPSAAPTSSANASSLLTACSNDAQDRHLVMRNDGKLVFLPRLPRLQHVFLAQLALVGDQRELQCVVRSFE